MVVKDYTSPSGARIFIHDDYLKSPEEQKQIIEQMTLRIQRYLVGEVLKETKGNTA